MLPSSNPFVLAPMAGITDMPFRRLMKRLGAGCVISEFVSAHGIVNGGPKVKRYLSYHEEERPVGIQLFGGEPEILAEAAKIIADSGVDFVDINMGCPVPKVTRKGGGSAWLCRTNELGAMFRTVKSAINIPISIKIRVGWDQETKNALEICRIAREEGYAAVAVHGRTRAQGYAGLADWDFIQNLQQEAGIPIIGNGDIVSGPMAAARLITSGCPAVMIGRGALKNPWIFREGLEALERVSALPEGERLAVAQASLERQRPPSAGEIPEGKHYYERKVKRLQPAPVSFVADWVRIRADRDAAALVREHLSLLQEVYPEVKAKLALRKFLAWYAAGYPNAHAFRKFIFTHDELDVILERAYEFFESVKALGVNDEQRDADPVLMSGHG